MQLQHQKITLDVNDTRAFTILNAHQGDSKTRFIDVTLTENGSTITLSSNYVATVKASINNKTKAVNTAVVNTTNNIITVELTKVMLDTPGLLNCEVILQDNQQFVTSATFTVKVAESVISDESEIVASQEFGKLLDALIEIKDVEDKADRVQTLVDNIDKLESADDIINRLSNVESKETWLETQHRTDVQGLNDKTNNIVEQANTDRQNFNNSVDEINTTLDTKENVSNKVSVIEHPSLDYYPDTKAVWDYVTSKLSTPLADIETLKSGKLDKTDFNTYKIATDKAIEENTKSIKANATAIDKCVTDIANNSALISKNQINVTTDKSTSIALNDSSNYNVVSLVAENDNYNLSLYGKNLLNFNDFSKKIYTNAYVAKDSLTVKDNTISYDMTEGKFCGVYFKYNEFIKDRLLINKSCIISLTVTVDKACTFRLQDGNSNKFVSKVLEPSTETQISLPVALNQSTKAIIFDGVNITETTHIKLSNIMIELGSVATEYEDYKDMRSVTQNTDLSTVHTYYPSTTVICDSDFQLTYIADTKNYIDNKFNELATALVAHESEVN